MALLPGTRLGPFEVTAQIGVGGMGEVYRATDTNLKRAVAIKVLPAAVAADAERLARFQREAEVLASLNHSNIAAIYGLERSAGTTALVMELVEGPTLADRIVQGPIPLDEAQPIGKQIAEALAAAHEQGIIHRDLKPANIKMRPDGTVKVLDFGLAKAMEPAVGSSTSMSMSPTITTPAMTQAGVILGTSAYMSPEQAKGRPTDKRSDVWAFGCVLYEMLSGARPFDGEDSADVLGAVVRLEPDWSRLPADTPAAIRTLLQGCLTKDRRQRIGDIAVALFTLRTPFPAPTATSVAPASHRLSWGRRAMPFALGAATVGLVWLAISSLQRPASAPPVTRFPVALGEGQSFTNRGRNTVAISPDGTTIAYVANQRLYLRPLSGLDARPIVGTEGNAVTSPVFSPDGLSIAFYADDAIKRIGLSGGVAVTLCPATNPFGMSWRGDGILFGQGTRGILRVAANGGTPDVLIPIKEGEVAHGPFLLPDGEVLFTLAMSAGNDRWDKAQIVVHSPDSDTRKVLIRGGSDARYLPTGHLVYAVSGSLFAARFDPRRLEVLGEPAPVLEGVSRAAAGSTGTAHFDVSATGALIYVPGPRSAFSGGQYDLAFVDRSGKVVPLGLPTGPYEAPRVSPDGTRVAFGSDDGTDVSVLIYELSGASAVRKLTLSGRNRYPVWAPDSQRVAFQSDREGDLGIFWQRADGTGEVERLTKADTGTSHAPESWSRGGEALIFSATKGSRVSLWTLSFRDKTTSPFGEAESWETMDPSFSPDGRWIAYEATDAARNPRIYVEPFPRTGERYLAANDVGRNPFWSPSGTELLFAPGASMFQSVRVTTRPGVAFGNPEPVLRGGLYAPSAEVRRNYDPAPDGKRILGVFDAGQAQSAAPATPTVQVVLNWHEELKQLVPTR